MVESGKTATALTGAELPTRSGFTLSGWNTKADGKGTAFVFGTTTVTADITIFAQWTQNVPAVPTGLTATAISTSQINLAWTAVATATKYNLFDGTTQIGGDITTTSYSHTGLAGSSTHSYTLKACNSGGCSAASSAVSATTSDILPIVIEHPKGTVAIRDRHGLFKIQTNDGSLANYRLCVKKASDPAPTATEMENGSHLKRDLSTTPIYVLVNHYLNAPIVDWMKAGHKTADLPTGTNVDKAIIYDGAVSTATNKWINLSLLTPNTAHKLYGMKAGGTQVTELLSFSTDATPTANPFTLDANDSNSKIQYLDITLTDNPIVVKDGEFFIFPLQHIYTAPNVGSGVLYRYMGETVGYFFFKNIPATTISGWSKYYNTGNTWFLMSGSHNTGETLADYGTFALMDITYYRNLDNPSPLRTEITILLKQVMNGGDGARTTTSNIILSVQEK